jgi:RNA polymerase sigma-70 factor (ECF subfamily)
MYLHELTSEQQSFAEDNHNLVYTFLRNKGLRQDDFYDVIIFGYLRAVQKYLIRENLRLQYEFSTIAWRAMECDLANHYKAQSRPSRKAVTISLDAMVNDGQLTVAETIPDPDLFEDRLDAGFLWEEIISLLTPEQTDVLRMRADGYTTREIAAARRSPLREIESLFSSALESARVLSLA